MRNSSDYRRPVTDVLQLDERTRVTPSALAHLLRPRIEVWYRAKLGNRDPVNDRESIGQTLEEGLPATAPEHLRLFEAGEGGRIDAFDVARRTPGRYPQPTLESKPFHEHT